MNSKMKWSLIVFTAAAALFAVAFVAASPSPSHTPLYTLRMERASNQMHYLPTDVTEFTYTTETGWNLDYAVAGNYSGHAPEQNTMHTFCGGLWTCDNSTCQWTCEQTCDPTCFMPTCRLSTCDPNCVPFTMEPTCYSHFTCEMSTCQPTCDPTCDYPPSMCMYTCMTCDPLPTCEPTCFSDWTCMKSTCNATCNHTCGFC